MLTRDEKITLEDQNSSYSNVTSKRHRLQQHMYSGSHFGEVTDGYGGVGYGILPCMCYIFLGSTSTQELSACADTAFISYY